MKLTNVSKRTYNIKFCIILPQIKADYGELLVYVDQFTLAFVSFDTEGLAHRHLLSKSR